MKLVEFDRGSEIIISSAKRHSRHDFNTAIISAKTEKNIVFVKPVLVGGKRVRFSDPEIKHVVTVNAGSKVYTYHDIKLREVRVSSTKNKYVLCIESEEDVAAVNRRNFFRVYLGVSGTLLTKMNCRQQEVVVKDISANGLGVICPKTMRLSIGTRVFVNFVDGLTQEEFKVDCMIVRCEKHNEESILYGCQLPESNDEMEKFVALKQRIH